MEVQLKPWGNSLGIRIPKAILKEAGFQYDETFVIKSESDRIILMRKHKHQTLEERAKKYDGKLNLEGESDWRGAPAGNEVW